MSGLMWLHGWNKWKSINGSLTDQHSGERRQRKLTVPINGICPMCGLAKQNYGLTLIEGTQV
eukprot:6642294-Pyramimonas_sp.AAC.1